MGRRLGESSISKRGGVKDELSPTSGALAGIAHCKARSNASVLAGSDNPSRGSDFQVCSVAGFQTGFQACEPDAFDIVPIWKSAIQQVWRPALRPQRLRHSSAHEFSLASGVPALYFASP
jgi:hypothetical protein